ncbi:MULTISPECIES: YbfB/YjiJ family MFS transporter [unclassified Neptuniibacter]|jgi:predicted MFS family arabinose efflux permease|uniref:YbfB/YjiJ family MFS transporter n=1 Tax=unclassified Neptuniibacter TaxID=2630693 RepID=UPI0026E1E592|nr:MULTISPECIES: YbfB/YjiJ family MFS transporter [unclassified Neptuniibacter]MDO6513402.1 YbfB/YjiJ family MFS transporter [Neptuniibacter sp. 2_MG-2023]MDO6593931.1 YbfB/YjiJ family MFS transporter [Neptuniibacter sp. 1_MG-2023]
MTTQLQKYKVLIAGIFSLMLMLGVARFSYTPMLPIMQAQAGIGDAVGGWLATFNYMGYMTGAFIAASISDLVLKDKLYRWGLIVAILTTAGMAVTDNVIIWGIMRFFAGLTSAAGLLIGSGLILNWLIRHNFRSELGIHFSGMGLGIIFCSAVVALMDIKLNWQELWWLFAGLGVLLAIPAWAWLPRPDTSGTTISGAQMVDNPPSKRFLFLMLSAYFCAGYGYVISATFIVAIVDRQEALQGLGPIVFLIVGVAAAPACIIWDLIARQLGVLTALLIAYIIQILGIILPALTDSAIAVIISAVLFGGTFIGIVSLVLTMAGRFYPTKPAKLMGKMTLTYGVAQIIAPAITGNLAERLGDYNLGLWIAAGMVLLGAVISTILMITERDAL